MVQTKTSIFPKRLYTVNNDKNRNNPNRLGT